MPVLHWPNGSESAPVVIPLELRTAFEKARHTVACFGDGKQTVANHCLQLATAFHYSKAPAFQLYKRDMVIMAIFHDVFVEGGPPSTDGHGLQAARLLDGLLHPHVIETLRRHTDMHEGLTEDDLMEFPKSLRGLIGEFAKTDGRLIHADTVQLPLSFFFQAGYLTYSASPELKKVWISSNRTLVWAAPSMWIERTPVLLAQKLRLFERNGLPPVELRVANGGPELLAMVARGEAHVGEIGLFPFAKYASQTPEAERACCLVGSTFMQQLDHYLVGPPGSSEGMAALKGKKVGILSKGSCDSYLLNVALMSAGIDTETVESVPLGAHYGKIGCLDTVDGAWFVEPTLSQAEAKGQVSVLMKASSLFPRFQWGAILASDTLRQEEDDLHRILGVYAEACRLMHEAISGAAPHIVDQVLSLGPDFFDVPPEIFHKALLRDIGSWQLSWMNVDYQGADVCLEIMQNLGELQQPLVAKDLFCVPGEKDIAFAEQCNISRL